MIYLVYDVFKAIPNNIERQMEFISSVSLSPRGATRLRKRSNEPMITFGIPISFNGEKEERMLFFTFPHRVAGTVLPLLKRFRIAFYKKSKVKEYLSGTVNDEIYGGFRVIKRKLYK